MICVSRASRSLASFILQIRKTLVIRMPTVKVSHYILHSGQMFTQHFKFLISNMHKRLQEQFQGVHGSLEHDENKSSAVAEMGNRGHNRMGRKEGGRAAVPLLWRAGTLTNTMWPGPSILPYQLVSSSIQLFGHNKYEWKTGGLCPLLGGAATPSKTPSPGPRFTYAPSSILIHPAVWPQ